MQPSVKFDLFSLAIIPSTTNESQPRPIVFIFLLHATLDHVPWKYKLSLVLETTRCVAKQDSYQPNPSPTLQCKHFVGDTSILQYHPLLCLVIHDCNFLNFILALTVYIVNAPE